MKLFVGKGAEPLLGQESSVGKHLHLEVDTGIGQIWWISVDLYQLADTDNEYQLSVQH